MKKIVALLALSAVLLGGCNNEQHPLSEEKKQSETTTQKMNNKDYTTSIVVDKTPAVAFNAIKDFRAWWSEEIEGKTDQLNETFFYHYKDVHLSKIKLIEVVPEKKNSVPGSCKRIQFHERQDGVDWHQINFRFDAGRRLHQNRIYP